MLILIEASVIFTTNISKGERPPASVYLPATASLMQIIQKLNLFYVSLNNGYPRLINIKLFYISIRFVRRFYSVMLVSSV